MRLRISDWISDLCSSYLGGRHWATARSAAAPPTRTPPKRPRLSLPSVMIARSASSETGLGDGDRGAAALIDHEPEIIARLRDRGVVEVAQLATGEKIAHNGRAAWRERVWQYGEIPG